MLVLLQGLLGVTLGLFLSAFARTEFQAVQFLPAVVLPQVLLAGLLLPVERLPRALELVARVLPLTYAFEALDRVIQQGRGLDDGRVALDLVVLAATFVVLLAAGSLTLPRTEA
jgi:ABC-2 type transport system permease protein